MLSKKKKGASTNCKKKNIFSVMILGFILKQKFKIGAVKKVLGTKKCTYSPTRIPQIQ